MVEHPPDIFTRHLVGDDGRADHERHKGKPFNGAAVEVGDTARYTLRRRPGRDFKLDVSWGGGHYLGTKRRAGEAIVGMDCGSMFPSVVRRMARHRRWDRESLQGVVGVPWSKSVQEQDEPRSRWWEQSMPHAAAGATWRHAERE